MEQPVNSEPTGKYDRRKSLPHAFKPGQSGNPAGRPKGSRNLLGQKFIDDMYEVWQRRGKEVLERLADEDPAALARLAANLLPQKVEAEISHQVQVVMLPAPRSRDELEQLHQQRLLDVTPSKG